jgi:WhiB family redox-sensing transcriptional regulator
MNLDPLPWMDDASCAKENPALWFPEKGDRKTVALAKAICAECPVRKQCRTFSQETNVIYGIWGGKSPRHKETAA